MDVVVLKMVNGDEVITELKEEAEGFVVLSRPRVLQMMHGQQGVQMGLIPWIMSAPDESCVVQKEGILTSITAPNDISKAYLQQVSSIQLMG
jgi:hypothetical protein